jgi:GntR family transcriptional regulator of vanillate catabolism
MAESKGATHAKRAAYELRQRIVNGELPGGTRLYEVALAEELDISRTPVREAMSRLAEEGLLERARGGGFVVRSFTLQDVCDAIELRGVLEGTAARLAAEQGVSEEDLKPIRAITDQIDTCFGAIGEPIDFDRYSELNAAFHEALAQLCGSRIVIRELERVKSLPFASPSAFVLGRGRSATSHRSLVLAQQQHRALIDAIAHREGARAESLAREHARIARENLESTRGAGEEAGQPLPGLALVVD